MTEQTDWLGSHKHNIEWSLPYAAHVFEIDIDVLKRMVDKAALQKTTLTTPFKYSAQEIANLVVQYRIKRHVQNVEQEGINPNALAPMDRKYWFDSERSRITFERETKELVQIDEFRVALAAVMKPLQELLDILPDEIDRKVALPPEAVEMLHATIDAQRSMIVSRLMEIGSDG